MIAMSKIHPGQSSRPWNCTYLILAWVALLTGKHLTSGGSSLGDVTDRHMTLVTPRYGGVFARGTATTHSERCIMCRPQSSTASARKTKRLHTIYTFA
ncbi:hypothetical protein B0J11DRAFT_110539 [Dendryphion nanum]|uniref:Secreted protein n=1 Tax=Dendryphion nanum TaxID=256645 RepID=A0A9P9IDT4_9PLEO|nr:hypothetical protein B0J11DRAFT_110539 [Dendryphion nanum]